MKNEFKPITSSNLEAAKYDPATSGLIIRFKNGTAYEKSSGISPELYADFEKTFDGNPSPGKFHAQQLKPLPDWNRIEDWK